MALAWLYDGLPVEGSVQFNYRAAFELPPVEPEPPVEPPPGGGPQAARARGPGGHRRA